MSETMPETTSEKAKIDNSSPEKKPVRKQMRKQEKASNMWTAVFVVAALVIMAFFAGYYTGFKQNRGITPANTNNQNNTSAKQELTIIDDYGRTVSVVKYPKRIISLAASSTEVVYSIGLGNRIVGVDDFSDYPEDAKNKTKVGSFDLSYEVIAGLKPDIIVGADIISRQTVSTLEKRGYVVIILAPKSLNGILQDIRLLGLVTGKEKEANDLAGRLDSRISNVTAKTSGANVSRLKTYLEYYPYFTYGPGSIGNDLILMAGGFNIASNTTVQYPQVTKEFVIASNPEIIVFTQGAFTDTTVEKVKQRPGWSVIDAVKSDKIYSIDDNSISRPGPRMVNGLEDLAKLIHPELFSP
jgi:iron complex transport system substrate-binding protein